jgi:hypothetical protein
LPPFGSNPLSIEVIVKRNLSTVSESDLHMARLRRATLDFIREQCASKEIAEKIVTSWLIFENGLHKWYQAVPPELPSCAIEMESLYPGIFGKIHHMRISYTFPTGKSGRKPKIPDHKIKYAARLHSRYKSLNHVLQTAGNCRNTFTAWAGPCKTIRESREDR